MWDIVNVLILIVLVPYAIVTIIGSIYLFFKCWPLTFPITGIAYWLATN